MTGYKSCREKVTSWSVQSKTSRFETIPEAERISIPIERQSRLWFLNRIFLHFFLVANRNGFEWLQLKWFICNEPISLFLYQPFWGQWIMSLFRSENNRLGAQSGSCTPNAIGLNEGKSMWHCHWSHSASQSVWTRQCEWQSFIMLLPNRIESSRSSLLVSIDSSQSTAHWVHSSAVRDHELIKTY